MKVRDLVKHLVTHYKLEDTVLLHIETEEQHLYTEATNVWRIDNNTIAIVSKKENKEWLNLIKGMENLEWLTRV